MGLLLNTYQYLMQGGWIMIPLAVCSMVMWILIMERLITYYQLSQRSVDTVTAIAIVQGAQEPIVGGGLYARLVRCFVDSRSGVPDVDVEIMRECTMRLRRDLAKSLAVIAVLAGVAPVLGLLGTVLGMIETFNVISIFGTGNAKAMAGGISVALVTTQAGLLVAIPGLFLSGFLNRRSRRFSTELDEIAKRLERAVRRTSKPASVPATTLSRSSERTTRPKSLIRGVANA